MCVSEMRELRHLPGMSRLFLLVLLAAAASAVQWETQSRVRFTGDFRVGVNDGRLSDCNFVYDGPHLLQVKSEDIVVVSADEDVLQSCNVTVSGREVLALSSIDNYATFVLYGKPLNVTVDTNVSLQCLGDMNYPLVRIEVKDDIASGTGGSCCNDNNLGKGCHRCGKGQYREGLSCLPCPDGKTTEKSGVYLPDQCACHEGYFADEGNCIMCEEGKYRLFSQDDTECTDCGHNNERGPGASNCTSDPQESPTEKTTSPPQYLQPRATTCDRFCCVPGEYWNDDRQECLDCTDGYNYSDFHGATTCQDCAVPEAGEEMVGCFSKNGSTRACKQGFYRPLGESSRTCLACEPGKTTSDTRTELETGCQCKPGFQQQPTFSNCTKCAQGMVKTTISSEDTCQQCGDSQTTRAKGSTSPSDCLCQAGYQRNAENQCTSCPSGKYKTEIGDEPCTTCESCSSGRLAYGCGGRTKGECKDCVDSDCDTDQTCDYCGICNYNKTYQTSLHSINSDLLQNHTTEFNSTLDLCEMCGGDITIANGYNTCHVCPAGTFGQDGPRVCNDTELETNIGEIETAYQCRRCTECSAGKYNNISGSSACLECPIGTFADTAAQTSCGKCGANMTTDAPGASSEEFCHCLPGFYHNHTNTTPSNHECFRCDPGYYSVARNQHVCTKCPAGQHNNHSDHFDNSSYCTQCPANTYSLEGAVDCNACVHATSPAGSTALANCSCDPGYVADTGDFCIPCTPGTYADESGSSTCTECPVGTTSNLTASTSIENCTACPKNTYRSEDDDACQPCVHAVSSEGSRSNANCTCLPGFFSGSASHPGSGACQACTAGTYTNTTGASTCVNCPAGTFSAAPNATICTKCAVGTYAAAGASQCSDCGGGGKSTILSGATSEDDCVCIRGYGFHGPNEQCEECERGKYKDELGNHECQNCSANTYSDALFRSNASDCISCQTGTFSNAGASECTSCAPGEFWNATTGGVCEACSLGKFSEDGADTVCTTCTFDNMRLNGTVFSTLQIDTEYGFVKETTCHTGSASADLCCLTTGVPARGNEGMCCSGQTQLNPVSGNEECTDHTQPGQCIYQCPYGTYKTSEANETCQLCPEGKYKQDAGTGPCYDCEADYGSVAGSEQCSNCGMGTQANENGMCEPCPNNTYRGGYLHYNIMRFSSDIVYASRFYPYGELQGSPNFIDHVDDPYEEGGYETIDADERNYIYITNTTNLVPADVGSTKFSFQFKAIIPTLQTTWWFGKITIYIAKWQPSTPGEELQIFSCFDIHWGQARDSQACSNSGDPPLLSSTSSVDSGCDFTYDLEQDLKCLKNAGSNAVVVDIYPSGLRAASVRMFSPNATGTNAKILVLLEPRADYDCQSCPNLSGGYATSTTEDPPTCMSKYTESMHNGTHVQNLPS